MVRERERVYLDGYLATSFSEVDGFIYNFFGRYCE
jgi:hypothetical protein